jgi:hypothetical protein
MGRRSVIAQLAIAVLVGVFLWFRHERSRVDPGTPTLSPPATAAGPTGVEALPPGVSRDAPRSTGPSLVSPASPQPESRLEPAVRERRQRVIDSLAARAPSAAPNAPVAPAQPTKDEPGTMRDRTGVMPETVKAINAQLGPLIDQCFDQAQERGVNQRGMLALAVKLASAEGVGRIIETLEPTARNAIDDAELIDCVRQSAFTVDLPDEGSGRTDFEMTIPYAPPSADAGSASSPR